MIPKSYPGIPSFSVKAGQVVKAADIQALLDWLKWFSVYFCPHHVFFSCDDGNKGQLTSYGSQTGSSVYTSNFLQYVGADGPGTITGSNFSGSYIEGVQKVSYDAKNATSSLGSSAGTGLVYVDAWQFPPDVTE